MPDILTHLIIGLAILLWNATWSREKRIFFLLGSILLDVERPFTYLAAFMNWTFLNLSVTFHSILGAVFLSLFAASLFSLTENSYWMRVKLLLCGTTCHLVLDLSMYVWEEWGIALLYPLKIYFSFHLFWPTFLYYPIIGFGVLFSSWCIHRLYMTVLPVYHQYRPSS